MQINLSKVAWSKVCVLLLGLWLEVLHLCVCECVPPTSAELGGPLVDTALP